MEFRQDAVIYSAAGEDLGRLERVVLDPGRGEVTHLVLRKGWFFQEDRVIPIDFVESSTEDEIRLGRQVQELEDLPLFEETHYVDPVGDEADVADEHRISAASAPLLYWYPPLSSAIGFPAYYRMPFAVETDRNIPDGSVPLKEGANVLVDDEHVGDVERIYTGDGDRVTHLVISSGRLFVKRKLIPTNWIATVSENEVRLGVSKEVLNRLPDFEE